MRHKGAASSVATGGRWDGKEEVAVAPLRTSSHWQQYVAWPARAAAVPATAACASERPQLRPRRRNTGRAIVLATASCGRHPGAHSLGFGSARSKPAAGADDVLAAAVLEAASRAAAPTPAYHEQMQGGRCSSAGSSSLAPNRQPVLPSPSGSGVGGGGAKNALETELSLGNVPSMGPKPTLLVGAEGRVKTLQQQAAGAVVVVQRVVRQRHAAAVAVSELRDRRFATAPPTQRDYAQ